MTGFHSIMTESSIRFGGTCWCGGRATSVGDQLVCLDSKYHDPRKLSKTPPMAKGMTLYLAGPMSNYPQNNYPAFNQAASLLERAGFTVVNPATYSAPAGQRVGYADLLREDLRRLLDCEGVATLPNWEASHGARNEVHTARGIFMPVGTVAQWANLGFTGSTVHTEEK